MVATAPEEPEGKYPADELRERHPDLWMKLRMDVIRIRHDKRPKDYSIDLILRTLQPLLKEEFNVGRVED